MMTLLQQIGRRSIRKAMIGSNAATSSTSAAAATIANTSCYSSSSSFSPFCCISLQQQQRRWIHDDNQRHSQQLCNDPNTTTNTTSNSHVASSLQQQQQQQRSLSTAAAADLYDEEELREQQEQVVVTHYQQQSQQQQQQRPRLTALRKRLQEEKGDFASMIIPPPATTTAALPNLATTMDDLNNLNAFDNILMDKYGRKHTYLRISLTERCNLRCTYCMPPEGVPLQPTSKLLATDEILLLTKHFLAAGVTKIRLTGGEPTLRKDITRIIQGISQLGREAGTHSEQQQQQQIQQLGMTTNGVTLSKHLHEYVDAGLNSINVSLDSLDPEKFAQLTRRPAKTFDRVYEAIQMANDLIQEQKDDDTFFAKDPTRKYLTLKVNCVVQKNINDNEIVDFCNLTKEFPNIQIRFIEYMPFTENGWNRTKFLSYQDMIQQNSLDNYDILRPITSGVDPHDTTKWFTYEPTGSKIGFITSMSNHFCAGCNRLRLTADGQIKVCLFDGNSTLSLRDCLRQSMKQIQKQEEESSIMQQSLLLSSSQNHDVLTHNLNQVIVNALQQKKFALGGHKSPDDISNSTGNRPMTLIGG